MTILFAGGEEGDLIKTSTACIVETSTTIRRSQYNRCALKVATASATDGWGAKFAASTSFWATARMKIGGNVFGSGNHGRGFALMDGSVIRLYVSTPASFAGLIYNQPICLIKVDAAGNKTQLATSATLFPGPDSLSKFDVQVVNYGTSATVRVYLEGVQIISYTGDVTTDGATSLNGLRLCAPTANNDWFWWSEVIVSTNDTRTLSLATLAPAAAGNAWSWTNSYAAVNEVTLDDTTIASSGTANQIAEATITNSTVPSTSGVVSVVVNARAQKGNTSGPANSSLLVRTGGTDYASPSAALPSGAFDLVSYSWDTNPATSATWAASDLTAVGFNIGIKSLT